MAVNNSGFSSQKRSKTTDWEEHSAVADISTGRRFKAVQDVPFQEKKEDVDVDNTYHGVTKPGILTAEPYWRISKITGDGTTFANGDDSFIFSWDSRASYNYTNVTVDSYLLLESGDTLLLESGDKFLLESIT